MTFEFDLAKSESNKLKHGIDFEEANALWDDEEAIEVPLPFESETRWLVIGVIGSKHWSAVITYRETIVRIISVRRSRMEEIDLYDNSKRI